MENRSVERAEDTEASCRMTSGLCFFAYLDILGFKNLVKQTSTLEQLMDAVKRFVEESARTIDNSRGFQSNGDNVYGRSAVPFLSVRIVSDSVCVWTEPSEDDDCLKRFDVLLQVVMRMLAYGLNNGLPLRGVVTYGELFSGKIKPPVDIPVDFLFDAYVLCGRALVEAYELEGQMEWSGAIVTPKAWAKVEKAFKEGRHMLSWNIKSATELFNHYPYLLWCYVPFKKGKKKAIVCNWNYRLKPAISGEKICKAFTERCNTDDATIALKFWNTLRFYERIKQFAEPCDMESVNAMPVPDSDYASRDLLNN